MSTEIHICLCIFYYICLKLNSAQLFLSFEFLHVSSSIFKDILASNSALSSSSTNSKNFPAILSSGCVPIPLYGGHAFSLVGSVEWHRSNSSLGTYSSLSETQLDHFSKIIFIDDPSEYDYGSQGQFTGLSCEQSNSSEEEARSNLKIQATKRY